MNKQQLKEIIKPIVREMLNEGDTIKLNKIKKGSIIKYFPPENPKKILQDKVVSVKFTNQERFFEIIRNNKSYYISQKYVADVIKY